MSTGTPVRKRLLALAMLATLGAASVAHADKPAVEPRNANAWRTQLRSVAKRRGMPSYERKLANGVKRVYVNPGPTHIVDMEQTLSTKSNVLEILHSDEPGANHTLAIFDRKLLHSQYSTAGNWRLRGWGRRLRGSDTKLYSALITLTSKEAANLRARLKAAFAEEGPERAAGENWEHGHLKVSLGVPGLNCVSTWCDMPIGEKGEPLHEIVGLDRSYSGDPRGFEQALERDANERVFGIAVYGPKVAGFDQSPQQDKVLQ